MAIIEPQSNITLLKLPIELDESNQLSFSNSTAQFNYFNSLNKLVCDDATYVRKDGVIRFPACVEDIREYNYVMYQNEAHSDKWFYAFITDMVYINDEMTAISISTDSWQTWQFDIEFKQSFIEREHVNDDRIGYHTIPENIEIGDYLIESSEEIYIDEGTPAICYMATQPPYDQAPMTYLTSSLGNVFCGLLVFATNAGGGKKIVDMYNVVGGSVGDALVNMYMIPSSLVDWEHPSDWSFHGVTCQVYPVKTNTVITNSGNFSESNSFGSFVPKNAKLLTYPYKYFHITNNSGIDIDYRWEDFSTGSDGLPMATYEVDAIASCGSTSKLHFTDYKNSTELNYAYGINGSKLPNCAWLNDYYTNWLTQNSVNIALNQIGGIVTAGVGAAFQSGAGVGQGIASIISTLAQSSIAQRTPAQARGDVSSGDLLFSTQECAFNVYSMRIRVEYAQIVDDYFSKFGYKINRVKIPNITGRLNWNFVKTIGCNIHLLAPKEDNDNIKTMFNNGITIWHNPATFLDYSQNNGII